MSTRKQRNRSAGGTAKTMSTLQMWQQQMEALKRASQTGENEDQADNIGLNKPKSEQLSTVSVYPNQSQKSQSQKTEL